ncbi:MAG TPA: hypothetical protein VGN18_05375 [Jatrophihabitans sp.]|jgi:D-alanyl-D-alanine carboxypeptidase (penicillin-binding protein 5/6)|uniref:D-alanyl-D-alanine carboxypeptidase family protein n=1 Tax=Jatrophihabitans sp. TaxID=1932789 RepID=UPI002DFAFADD|nr:hypothetical protein [Jatrophihabitans sp.]
MRAKRTTAALATLLTCLAPSALIGTASATPTHIVPPPAPTPTDSGNSPAAPDPHPPRGGIGPHGEAVGGARLLSRRDVLPPHAPALPDDLTAKSFVVANLDTGAVIAARDAHGRYQPASIQKLLTTVTLLPLLPGTKRVTVSRSAAETEGSHAGLVPGGNYTIDQIFRGLLLVSGNDCAEALAQAAGGRARTVALMNRTATNLGAYDTLVQTPSGLDGWSQLTSAYDMMLVLRAALAQPRFIAYDRVAHTYLPAQKAGDVAPVPLWNQNEQFLTQVRGALVAKTGYTDAAQHTFVGAIERGGHRYGVVLMRAQRWPDDQWVQATKLVKWAAALPTGTAPVGRLVTPAGPPAPRPSSSAARARVHADVAARKLTRDTGGVPTVLVIVLVVALLGGATAFTARHLRAQ